MDWNYQIGNLICDLRKEKGLSQKELGDRLGVTNKAVSKWENGASFPRVQLLPALAEILGCTQEALFLGIRKQADEPNAASRQSPYREYLTVVHRCDCCKHSIRIRKTLKCDVCGATLCLTKKAKALLIFISIVLFLAIMGICQMICADLTTDIFANGFSTPEEASFHAELLSRFPQIKLVASLSNVQIYLLGMVVFSVIWFFLIGKLLLKRLPLRIVRYPHAEDGKITF